jgi:cell division inhibitor SepF
MASFLKKTMLYLGLGPDDEYDVYDDAPEPVSDRRDRESNIATVTRVAPRLPHPPEATGGSVRAIRVGPATGTATATASSAAAVGVADLADVRPTRATSSVVRPIPREAAPVKPHSVTPLSFNDAQEIADWFKNPQPVIVNLEAAQRDLRRRLIDFCSGLCYGLGGQMERVADHVYLLTPSNVELSPEERRRLEHGVD